ncbi:MAG TPA: AI-2E family transporter [Albitalea sp.]|nr:AI-2E family transporter [Albitalea sp.]
MNPKLTPGRVLAAVVVAMTSWIVHGFVEAVLSACVIAIATWPLYAAFRVRLPRPLARRGGAALFTAAITAFLLAPMVFACGALLGEARTLLQAEQPEALQALTRHADASAVLGWAQSLGQFTLRHALTVAFTILLLAFFYQHGGNLACELRSALRRSIGGAADRYVAVGTRAVRASVNGMLAVGLFDSLATAAAYAATGAPRPLTWAAITGALAAMPFLGYAAVAALALQLAWQGLPTTALLVLLLGATVLLAGDKLVRPIVVRGGVQLPFVWVLMGCIGGFGALGLAGLVVGPVVLSLAREIWEERRRGAAG